MYVVRCGELIRGWQQSRPTADRPSTDTRCAPVNFDAERKPRARRIGDSAEFSGPPRRGHGENLQRAKERGRPAETSRPFIFGAYAARCSRRWSKGRVSSFLTLLLATSSPVSPFDVSHSFSSSPTTSAVDHLFIRSAFLHCEGTIVPANNNNNTYGTSRQECKNENARGSCRSCIL